MLSKTMPKMSVGEIEWNSPAFEEVIHSQICDLHRASVARIICHGHSRHHLTYRTIRRALLLRIAELESRVQTLEKQLAAAPAQATAPQAPADLSAPTSVPASVAQPDTPNTHPQLGFGGLNLRALMDRGER